MRQSVVVGIATDQADAVLLVAAGIAEQFGAELVCVSVDPAHFIQEDASGHRNFWPIDPDSGEDAGTIEAAEERVRAHLRDVLDRLRIDWSFRLVVGEAASGLSAVAAEVSAVIIVIGTSPRTVRRSAREFFTGSIAAHLAHRQPRPVLVVPLNPVLSDGALPWAGST